MKQTPPVSLHRPATYQIVVQGRLGTDWDEQFNGLRLSVTDGPAPVTTLSGLMPDQAALHGVLRALYGLGLPLIAVAVIPSEEER
jgi:hypothetical protein